MSIMKINQLFKVLEPIAKLRVNRVGSADATGPSGANTVPIWSGYAKGYPLLHRRNLLSEIACRTSTVSFAICSLIIASLFFGCSTVKMPTARELLSCKEDSKIYLSYNMWYTNSNLMTVENYPKGNILPAGSEVEIIRYDAEKIIFSDSTGNSYTLSYNEQRTMLPTTEFIKKAFSIKNPIANFDARVAEKIKKGIVSAGMTKEEILAARGLPMLTRTPNWPENNTWTYWADEDKYLKLVFKNEKLLEIIE